MFTSPLRILVAAAAAASCIVSSQVVGQNTPVDKPIDCNIVPLAVPAFRFQKCWESGIYRRGLETYQGWRLTYTDKTSEVVLGYAKPGTRGTLPPVHTDDLVKTFRTSPLFANSAIGMSSFGKVEAIGSDRFFSFARSSWAEHCKGFVRQGEPRSMGVTFLIMGFFCRHSETEISTEEARFFTDSIQLK